MKNPQLEPNPSILTLDGQDAATTGFYGATEAASRWVKRERNSAADERGPQDGEDSLKQAPGKDERKPKSWKGIVAGVSAEPVGTRCP
jgi:hypothetical protein